MYLPDAFRLDDQQTLLALALEHPFATLIAQVNGDLTVSHLPLLVDSKRRVLRGHLARANPQYAQLAENPQVLAIFHGPHAYVSPSAYEAPQPAVPTWNYLVVHVRGRARLIDEPALRTMLQDLVVHFDPTGWRMDAPEEYMRSQLSAIAGFEISIERMQGKAKLSQNRSHEDRERVAAWLESGDETSQAVAALMRPRR